jgi:hypothetical protein
MNKLIFLYVWYVYWNILLQLRCNFQVKQILGQITDPCFFLCPRFHIGYKIIIKSILYIFIVKIMIIDSRF